MKVGGGIRGEYADMSNNKSGKESGSPKVQGFLHKD